MINTLGIQGNVASIEHTMSQIVRAVERGNVATIKPHAQTVLDYCANIRGLLNESAHHVEMVADLSTPIEPPSAIPAVEVPAWISDRWRTMESPPPTDEDGSQVGDDPRVGESVVEPTKNGS